MRLSADATFPLGFIRISKGMDIFQKFESVRVCSEGHRRRDFT